LLKTDHKVAVLSRGYKRKTSGFVLADSKCSPKTIGDEPYQIFSKFPDILVAVDENRRRGINSLLNLGEGKAPDIILLDDAFQHRYVKPGFSILLTDYNRPIYEDALLPTGLLREPVSAKDRANIVIVTKCPDDLLPIDARIIEKHLNLYPYQSLFFTTFRYQRLKPLFPESGRDYIDLNDQGESPDVLLVTGIASPKPLYDELTKSGCKVTHLQYPDHYWYTKSDAEKIEKKFSEIKSGNKIIVVTEKDAVRLAGVGFQDDSVKKNIYYLPIEVFFFRNGEKDFDELIKEYVETDKRNRGISQGKIG
jgi:tetraacyldisaccharide 4'-kinase